MNLSHNEPRIVLKLVEVIQSQISFILSSSVRLRGPIIEEKISMQLTTTKTNQSLHYSNSNAKLRWNRNLRKKSGGWNFCNLSIFILHNRTQCMEMSMPKNEPGNEKRKWTYFLRQGQSEAENELIKLQMQAWKDFSKIAHIKRIPSVLKVSSKVTRTIKLSFHFIKSRTMLILLGRWNFQVYHLQLFFVLFWFWM